MLFYYKVMQAKVADGMETIYTWSNFEEQSDLYYVCPDLPVWKLRIIT